MDLTTLEEMVLVGSAQHCTKGKTRQRKAHVLGEIPKTLN
jgi:hypothetical protein